jgi:hypothetical protein
MSYASPLETEKSPKEIINVHFNHFLPIKGGWGYSKEDAVIIDKNDPSIISSEIFNGVKYEYEFVEKRIYEEFIINKPPSEQYAGITWELIEQKLIKDENNTYDCLLFKVSAFLLNDWNELKKEWETNSLNPNFDRTEHIQRAEKKKITFESEFWFEISSFYGNYDGLILKNPKTGKDEVVKVEINEEVLNKNNSHDELSLEEKIKISNPIDIIKGYKLVLVDGIYYTYCENNNSFDSVIGLEQAYLTIERKKLPCFNQALENIEGYNIYFIDNKYYVCDETNKYIDSSDALFQAKSIINGDRLDKKFNPSKNEKKDKSEFSIFLTYMNNLFKSLTKLAFFVMSIYFLLFHFNHIPNGKYIAQTVKINNNVIGEGTSESKKYDFILHKNNVLIDKMPYLLNEKDSNLFRKKYFNMLNLDEELTITFMGNVEINNREDFPDACIGWRISTRRGDILC